MQQTDHYKLNLIEKTDTFSPDPLNDNARKLDAALDARFTALDGAAAALDGRVTALEVHHIAVGRYIGNGGTLPIRLGFTPTVVLIQESNARAAISTKECPYCNSILIVENGFDAVTTSGFDFNSNGHYYIYCAIS